MSEDEARGQMQDEEGADVDSHLLRRVNDEGTEELRREGEDDDVEAHRKGMV
jgi:hypothetical protein